MFWADIIAKNLNAKGVQVVADGKTPSGKVHVGALRGVLIHDFVYQALLSQKITAQYFYYFDDFDPMDGLPVYLDKEKYEKFMGIPLKDIPAPDGEGSYANYYAEDFKKVFTKLGAEPEILWTSQLYKSGKFDPAIKIVLDNAERIQEIYHRVSGSQKVKGWLPFQPVCPGCGKVGTTLATKWDGKEVEFICKKDLVVWVKGCGYEGKISPFGGTGKMPWKVEWPSKWFVLGTTVEGAGKDHSSAGGTRDVANNIYREVFQKEPPADVAYEHILFGGKKMSSSKGLGSSAAEVADLLPAEVLRFLFARVPYQRAIDFDPGQPNTIPDLFDEFDRGQKAYFDKSNPDLAATWKAAQIAHLADLSAARQDGQGEIKEEFNLRFNLIKEYLNNLKTAEDILVEAEKTKKAKLTLADQEAIKTRIKYVKIWLAKFAQEEKSEKIELNEKQKQLLKTIAQELTEKMTEDETQNFIYNKGKDLGLKPLETFQAVYRALIGKDQGPKAGVLVKSLKIEEVKEKFKTSAK